VLCPTDAISSYSQVTGQDVVPFNSSNDVTFMLQVVHCESQHIVTGLYAG